MHARAGSLEFRASALTCYVTQCICNDTRESNSRATDLERKETCSQYFSRFSFCSRSRSRWPMSKPYLKIIRVNAAVTSKPNLDLTRRALATRKAVSESVRSLKKLGQLDYSLGQARLHLITG